MARTAKLRAEESWNLTGPPNLTKSTMRASLFGEFTEPEQATTDETIERLADRIADRIMKSSKASTLTRTSSVSPVSSAVLLAQAGTFPDIQFKAHPQEVIELKQRLQLLESVVDQLLSSKSATEQRVILLRTLTRDEAKEEIVQLFQSGETLDYGDIAVKLQIELPFVVDICNELEREGLIGSPS